MLAKPFKIRYKYRFEGFEINPCSLYYLIVESGEIEFGRANNG